MNSINRINSDKFILNIKKLKSQHFAKESRFFLHSPFKTPLKRANRKNNTPLGIIYTEIEKFDEKENSIYKKQYKFKGILAHILFWLAR